MHEVFLEGDKCMQPLDMMQIYAIVTWPWYAMDLMQKNK